MSDWTPLQRPIKTPQGVIFYGGPCKDDYENMEVYDASPRGSGLVLVLQRPALRALLEAQVRFARRSGWRKERIEKHTVRVGAKKVPEGRPIIVLPGSNRTCATQAALYKRDPRRYAAPQFTGHTRGLAIDVSQTQSNLSVIRTALLQEGWKQARSDEPWHYSYDVSI